MQFISKELWFPNPDEADDDGLLAVGGDLSPERLLLAYDKGIFPWFIDSGLVFWYCPAERFVLYPADLHLSHSLKQTIKKGKFTVTQNQDFESVIKLCAATHRFTKGSTWISEAFVNGYTALYKSGSATSVEVWEDNNLVGGLYGVITGKIFCGESMFSLAPGASKLALVYLCQCNAYSLIDCQVYSEHLAAMGAKLIGRKEFLQYVTDNL